MKLIVFCPYYPPHIGGLEYHADEFNKYLSQKDVSIIVFTPQLPFSALDLEIKHNGVKIIRFPAFEIISNYPLPKFWTIKFWRLFFDLFKKDFNMIISRTRFFNTSLLALVYAKIKKIKWIHIEHGSDFVQSGGKLSVFIAKIYDYTFGKLVLISADKVVANSKASAAFCQKIAPKINCEVIYRGVELEEIESVRPDLEIKNKYSDSIIITYAGRLIDGKGVSDLITAAKDAGENFNIFIIGDGSQRENLEKLSNDLKIEEHVIFFGHKNHSDTIALIKISDVIVNPSYTEGLPTTVVEAALCQKAIIATNVGGTPEIISGNNDGFLIEPKDIGLLKEKLEILIKDKNLREEFGKNAFEKARDKFNWDNSIEQYLKIFKNF